MTTVLLVRHGLTAATGHTLSGWTPGIPLDERGTAQARALGARLAALPLDAIISSPLDRCQQTAAAIAAAEGRPPGLASPGLASSGLASPGLASPGLASTVQTDERVGECHYGDWTGQELKVLAKEPLWKVVQAHPSAVRFPGPDGEAMLDMQHRAVTAVRDWNARLGDKATYLVCSHGDVIKALIADALGLHLDLSQRIQADPCSLTVIRYTSLRPFLLRMNDTGGSVEDLLPRPEADSSDAAADGQPDSDADSDANSDAGRDADSDAMVGGGAGAAGAVRDHSADARG